MNLAVFVDQSVRSVAPIEGISFGDLNDKKTWRIDFNKSATDQQKKDAQNIINNLVWDADAQEKMRKIERDANYSKDLAIKGLFANYKVSNPNSTLSDY